MKQIDNYDPGDAPRYLSLLAASEVRIDRPSWWATNRIPVGGTTLVAGREGDGKTALVCHLLAQATRGTLDGAFHGRPTDVVYIGHEDDHATVLVPRLMAAGADLTRFHFVALPAGGSFSVSIDCDALAAQVRKLDVSAIVVDPLDAHLGGGIDSHKKAEVQAAVARLATLAQSLRCAAVGIAHLNKGDSKDVLTKVVGSVGFTTSVRSVLAVGQHPEEPGDRVLVLRKANMTDASAVPAVLFRVLGAEVPHPDGGPAINTAKVEILGEEAGIDANAILSVPDAEERSARTEAAEWLAEILADGPMPAREVKRLARDADISERTLQRARQALHLVVERDENARGRPSRWALPDLEPPITGHPLFGTDGTKPNVAPDLGVSLDDSLSCHRQETESGTEPSTLARTHCQVCGEPSRYDVHPSCELPEEATG